MAQTENKKVFNVGVIGYGMSAKIFHIPFISTTPNLTLHSILQRNPGPSSSAPLDHPRIKHFTSLSPFLSDPALDVVILCTTPDTHFPLATQALEAGKHVFVEKPFVPTSTEADRLISLASARGLHLCVYQNRRWDSDFLTLRTLLSTGRLGRIVEIDTHFDRYRPTKPDPKAWKASLPLSSGGTALYDLGTHLVDQIYVLFGLPRSVFAKLVNQRDGVSLSPSTSSPDVFIPDSVDMQLFYDGGLTVHVRIGVHSAEVRQPRFWVRGTKGSFRKTGLDPQEDQLKAGMKTTDDKFGFEPEDFYGRLVTVGDDGSMTEEVYPTVEPATYAKIYELFGKSLSGEGPVPVPASEARDVLRVLEAARESALTRREVELAST
ncbi:oxidoreductase family protein [Poronia punctata]|nr:oxidoreductase family protein [Poronia punctata]